MISILFKRQSQHKTIINQAPCMIKDKYEPQDKYFGNEVNLGDHDLINT